MNCMPKIGQIFGSKSPLRTVRRQRSEPQAQASTGIDPQNKVGDPPNSLTK